MKSTAKDTAEKMANTNVFVPQASDDFVLTPYVQDITARALTYLDLGYAVHLSGPAGTGKTTLAMHIAAKLGRACTMLHGDDEFRASDLVGRDTGYRKTSVRDNYVSSIVKTEETLAVVWSGNRLTTACREGHTLIYDEFTRSPAQANNPFLSILEEGILNIPSSGEEKGYVSVHSNFRAIFTSNPEEYVGVHKMQDALLDRMITLQLDHPDRETEVSIVCSKGRCGRAEAEKIVDVVRGVRDVCGGVHGPTVRAAIAIAEISQRRGCNISSTDEVFRTTCQDVLYFNACRQAEGRVNREEINRIVRSCTRQTGNLHKDARPTTVEIATTSTVNNSVENIRTAPISLDTTDGKKDLSNGVTLPRPPAFDRGGLSQLTQEVATV